LPPLNIPLKDRFEEERDTIHWQIHARDYDTEMESCRRMETNENE